MFEIQELGWRGYMMPNSIWPAAFMHAVNNASPSVMILFMRQDVQIPLMLIAIFCLFLLAGKKKAVTGNS